MAIEKYERINFLDHILRIDEKGKFIPVIDPNTGTQKIEPVTGLPVWEALQEGTRHNQKVMNHLDKNIEFNRNNIISLEATIRRIQIQLELDGRVPGNSGTFADPLDGSTNKIKLDKAMTYIPLAIAIGTTEFKVANVEGFTPFTQVTIFDDVAKEDVVITEVGADTIKVQALKNNYKKGAKVARSNVVIDTVNAEMGIGDWQTYKVELVEVV
ncbi:integrase [Lysinibacillus sp. CTST325]